MKNSHFRRETITIWKYSSFGQTQHFFGFETTVSNVEEFQVDPETPASEFYNEESEEEEKGQNISQENEYMMYAPQPLQLFQNSHDCNSSSYLTPTASQERDLLHQQLLGAQEEAVLEEFPTMKIIINRGDTDHSYSLSDGSTSLTPYGLLML